MAERVEYLNRYAQYMLDLQITRNPLHKEVYVVFCDVTRDHYQDAIIEEQGRIMKYAMVFKSTDMHYVQEDIYSSQRNQVLSEMLLEDTDNPWVISLTITGFYEQFGRIPRMDDQVVIDGIRYAISEVRPCNRNLDHIILLKVYPERDPVVEEFAISKVIDNHDGTMFVSCSGNPKFMSFCIILADESVYQLPWVPFNTTFKIPGTEVKFSFCNSVSNYTYSTYYWNPDTGIPEIKCPSGAPKIVEDCEFAKYIAMEGDERPVYFTVDGTTPTSDSTIYSTPIPMGEYYRIYFMDANGTQLHYDNPALNL